MNHPADPAGRASHGRTVAHRVAQRLAGRVADRLGRSLRDLRPARVSVVVAVLGASPYLPTALDSLLAGGPRLDVLLARPPGDRSAGSAVDAALTAYGGRVRVPPAPEPGATDGGPGSWLDAAVAAAKGEWLAFVGAGDVVPPGALAGLLGAVEDSGSDVAVGVQRDVRGERARPVPWAASVLTSGRGLAVADRPGLLVDLDPTGKLFRTSRWRSEAGVLTSWTAAPAAVGRVLLAAHGIDVLPAVVHERHDRQTSLPVTERDRFSPDLLAERWDAWMRVAASLSSQPPAVREAWCAGLLEHLLPPLSQDAVGGGEPYATVLLPRVAALLDELPDGVEARVTLSARLGAWAAGEGTLDDVALVQDHLLDHPHGLPVGPGEGGLLADLPDGLEEQPEARWRRVEDVDRRLRSRVSLHREEGGAQACWVLEGAAFVAHVPDGPLPEVRMAAGSGVDGDGPDGAGAGRPVAVRRRVAAELEAWAARAHEDRAGCGFVADLAAEDLPGDGPWRVTVRLGGQEHEHVVRRPAARPLPQVSLHGLRVHDDVLLARVEAPGVTGPVALRLVGTKASTAAVVAHGAAGAPDALALPLAVEQLGERALLPAGRYELRATAADGTPATLGVPPEPETLELVSDRLRLVVQGHGDGLRLTVTSPPGAAEASARGQQRLLDGVYRAGRARDAAPTTVLLETFRGRSTGDNPGAVGRALLASERARAAGLEVAVVVDDPSVVAPAGTRAVVRRTREWYALMAGAGLYVANAAAPSWFEKAPGQVHVQTWHGTPLKRIGRGPRPGRPGHLAAPSPRRGAGRRVGRDGLPEPVRHRGVPQRLRLRGPGARGRVPPQRRAARPRRRRAPHPGAGPPGPGRRATGWCSTPRPGGSTRASATPSRCTSTPRPWCGPSGRRGAGARALQLHHAGRRVHRPPAHPRRHAPPRRRRPLPGRGRTGDRLLVGDVRLRADRPARPAAGARPRAVPRRRARLLLRRGDPLPGSAGRDHRRGGRRADRPGRRRGGPGGVPPRLLPLRGWRGFRAGGRVLSGPPERHVLVRDTHETVPMSKLRTLASATKRRLVHPPVDELRAEVDTMRRLNQRLEKAVRRTEVPAQGGAKADGQAAGKPAAKAGGGMPADYDDEAKQILTAVRPYTMTSNEKLYALVTAVRYVVDAGIEGDLVECGVWRGGSMHAVARTLLSKGVSDRHLHLFDTFSGMTEPTEKDVSLHVGKSAAELLETSSRDSHTWAVASRDDVEQGLATLDYPQELFHLVEGPVEQTIPDGAPHRIALLRLDTDWYESTRHELEHLYDRLQPGGVLIIDDYGSWQGSKQATDEFIAGLEHKPLMVRAGRSRIGTKPGR